MLIVGIMTGVASILGLPWCVAATVLCLGHVNSLKMETETSAPGEKPTFLGVREQRVTGTLVFILTGLSVKLAPVLAVNFTLIFTKPLGRSVTACFDFFQYIPMPVLYGVLLYMGVSSLKGMQFIDRLGLIFMPPKYQPDYSYLRHVPILKVHLFTFIQVFWILPRFIFRSKVNKFLFFRRWLWQFYGFWNRQRLHFCFLWWFWRWLDFENQWTGFQKFSANAICIILTIWCLHRLTKRPMKIQMSQRRR